MARGFPKDLLSVADLTQDQLSLLMDLARALEGAWRAGVVERPLEGRVVVAWGIDRGDVETLATLGAWGKEGVELVEVSPGPWPEDGDAPGDPDTLRALGLVADGLLVGPGARQEDLGCLGELCPAPVVALGGAGDAVAALAQLMAVADLRDGTLEGLRGLRVAFVGGAGPRLERQLLLAAMVGWELVQCGPRELWDARLAGRGRCVEGLDRLPPSDLLVLDRWDVGGEGSDKGARMARFFPDHQLTRERHRTMEPKPWICHDLPLRRGEEVVDALVDGAYSLVWEQVRWLVPVAAAVAETVVGPPIATDEREAACARLDGGRRRLG